MRRIPRITRFLRTASTRRWCASGVAVPPADALQRCAALLEAHGGRPGFFSEVCGALPANVQSQLAREALDQECETRLCDGGAGKIEQLISSLPAAHVNVLGVAVVSRHLGGQFGDDVLSADADSDGIIDHAEFRRWLRAGVGEDKPDVERPSTRQLTQFSLNSAIPFVVFGILDNSIMIVGGDVVEDHIGSMFSLSTLACAALANTFADVFGISVGNTVEALTSKLGLPQANLTADQCKLKVVTRLQMVSSSGGILVGCIIGMFPLLWINQERRKIEGCFADMDFDQDGLLNFQEYEHLLMDLGLSPKRVPLEVTQTAFRQFNIEKISLDQFILAYDEIQVIHEGLKKMKKHSTELRRAAEAQAK